MFIPKIGEDEPILTFAYFSKGLVQPRTRRRVRRFSHDIVCGMIASEFPVYGKMIPSTT